METFREMNYLIDQIDALQVVDEAIKGFTDKYAIQDDQYSQCLQVINEMHMTIN